MSKTYSDLNTKMIKGIKKEIDPKNIFAVNNVTYADWEQEIDKISPDPKKKFTGEIPLD